MITIGSLTFTPEAVAKLGLEEQSPFEQPSIKEGTQVAGSGVSVQTERGLLESGVHPDEEMQKAWDERKQKKTTEPTYKDTGETQTQTYERVMGTEAAQKKKQEQEERRKKLFEELQKQKEIYDKKTFLEKVSSTWDTFMGTDEASKEKMMQLGTDLLQTTPAGAVAGTLKQVVTKPLPEVLKLKSALTSASEQINKVQIHSRDFLDELEDAFEMALSEGIPGPLLHVRDMAKSLGYGNDVTYSLDQAYKAAKDVELKMKQSSFFKELPKEDLAKWNLINKAKEKITNIDQQIDDVLKKGNLPKEYRYKDLTKSQQYYARKRADLEDLKQRIESEIERPSKAVEKLLSLGFGSRSAQQELKYLDVEQLQKLIEK